MNKHSDDLYDPIAEVAIPKAAFIVSSYLHDWPRREDRVLNSDGEIWDFVKSLPPKERRLIVEIAEAVGEWIDRLHGDGHWCADLDAIIEARTSEVRHG